MLDGEQEAHLIALGVCLFNALSPNLV
jgi:hypothetical protein